MSEVQWDTFRAVVVGTIASLCLVMLAVVEQKPCKVPETEKLGNYPVWDYCGTERERQAINDE